VIPRTSEGGVRRSGAEFARGGSVKLIGRWNGLSALDVSPMTPTTTGSSAVGLWVDIRRAPDRRSPFADLVAATIG
jgi:hypothetical protein